MICGRHIGCHIAFDQHPETAMIRRTINWGGDLVRGLGGGLAPLVDLGARLWLAQLFFVASATTLAGAPGAGARLYSCFADWSQAPTHFGAGVLTASLFTSGLLAAGIATRFAAAVLMVGLALGHFHGPGEPLNFVWAAMLGWFAVHGGGALSIDRLLSRGAEASATPLAAPTAAAMSGLNAASPFYLFALRIALTTPPLMMALGVSEPIAHVADALLAGDAVVRFLSTPLAPQEAWLLGAASVLFGIGLLTRGIALVVAVLMYVGASRAGLGAEAVAAAVLPLLFFVRGPGVLSLDGLLRFEGKSKPVDESAPHVVILGAGFGGLSAAKALSGAKVRISVVDRSNHHLFQPLLYQVATAALSPADIATPIRELFRGQPNVRTVLGEATGIDPQSKSVTLGARTLNYDYLIVATGARHSYFGNDEWGAHAPGLKRLDDAIAIRNRLLTAFERAEQAETDAERRKRLTFVIVGGGPTGVELAGALAELAQHGMAGDFRACDPASARIVLIDRGDRPLKAMSKSMSAVTAKALQDLGVELRFGEGVAAIDSDGATLSSGGRIEADNVLWAAGVASSPAGAWLGVETDRAGRTPVGPHLEPEGLSDVFVVGDAAAITCQRGPVPGIAPADKQAGAYAARVIRARIAGRKGPKGFEYGHLGDLATIGRSAAVVDFNGWRLSGGLAWWLWGLAHVYFLTGLRNRASVAVHWLWSYLTYRRPTRIITGVLS